MRIFVDPVVVGATAFVFALSESLLLAADFVEDQTEAPNVNLAVVRL